MTRKDPLKDWRDDSGKLFEYAWPGGYTIIYLDGDNCVLCPDCANAADQDPEEFPNFKPVAGGLYEEGLPIQCERCQKWIESDYGDPDEEEQEKEES